MRPRWHDYVEIANTLDTLCSGYPGKAARQDGEAVWNLVAETVIEEHEVITDSLRQFAQMSRAPKIVKDIIEAYPADQRVRIPTRSLESARAWLAANCAEDEYMDFNYGEPFNVFLVMEANIAFELKMRFG